MEQYRKMLTKLKNETLARVNTLRHADFKIMPDEIDQVQEQENEEMRQRMLTRETQFLRQIESALESVERGTYGECTDCGGTISIGRLKARPIAARCVECQDEYEAS